MLKNILAEYVWNLVLLEDNPDSFVEVQTLLSGVTVGNYSLFDQQQILNQKNALNHLASSVTENNFLLRKSHIFKLHSLIAHAEALKWGCFRDGKVGIGDCILMSEGYHYLSIPGTKKDEFNKIMINVYNTKDASEGIDFFLSCYKK